MDLSNFRKYLNKEFGIRWQAAKKCTLKVWNITSTILTARTFSWVTTLTVSKSSRKWKHMRKLGFPKTPKRFVENKLRNSIHRKDNRCPWILLQSKTSRWETRALFGNNSGVSTEVEFDSKDSLINLYEP